MHFFPLHIGDYVTKAGHLSLLEDGAYNRLLRIYYDKEKPLPVDLATVQRLAGARGKDEKAAIERVLYEFFRLCDDGWRNEKADEVIASFYKKSDKARESAAARWAAKARVSMAEASERNANAMRTHCEGNATHNPIPITQNQKIKSSVRQAAPNADFDALWQAYPKRGGSNSKADARKCFEARVREGVAFADLMQGVTRYANFMQITGKVGTEFVMQASRFLGPGGHYLNDWDPPAAPAPAPRAPSRDMQAIINLEEMKHGLVRNGNHDRGAEALLLEAPGFAFGGNGARDRRGVD